MRSRWTNALATLNTERTRAKIEERKEKTKICHFIRKWFGYKLAEFSRGDPNRMRHNTFDPNKMCSIEAPSHELKKMQRNRFVSNTRKRSTLSERSEQHFPLRVETVLNSYLMVVRLIRHLPHQNAMCRFQAGLRLVSPNQHVIALCCVCGEYRLEVPSAMRLECRRGTCAPSHHISPTNIFVEASCFRRLVSFGRPRIRFSTSSEKRFVTWCRCCSLRTSTNAIHVYNMRAELTFDEVCVRQKYHSPTFDDPNRPYGEHCSRNGIQLEQCRLTVSTCFLIKFGQVEILSSSSSPPTFISVCECNRLQSIHKN